MNYIPVMVAEHEIPMMVSTYQMGIRDFNVNKVLEAAVKMQSTPSQKWSRSIIERYYGYGIANAYLCDEDQGQMSAWFVMAAIGLFQTDGGSRSNPVYEIGSPLYKKIEIDLRQVYGRGKKFTIIAAKRLIIK